MSLSSHLEELQKRHQDLSEQVEEAQKMLTYDELEVTRMKKEKLRLKEEINRLLHS